MGSGRGSVASCVVQVRGIVLESQYINWASELRAAHASVLHEAARRGADAGVS